MKDQKKNNKGFSLVELIVVVAIMAVLLGVLVPTLVRNVEKSKKQKDINNLSEVRNAIQLAMATEEFAGVEGTITITGKGFEITTSGTVTHENDNLALVGGSTTLVKADFWKEVLENLNASADFKFDFTSKLADDSTKIVFVLGDEKVSGFIDPAGSKYGSDPDIQLQDQVATTH